MAFLLILALCMCVATAYFAALDRGQIDLDRGVKVLLTMTTLLGWSLYAHEAWANNKALDNALETMRGVITIAVRQGAEMDSAQKAVDDVMGRLGP